MPCRQGIKPCEGCRANVISKASIPLSSRIFLRIIKSLAIMSGPLISAKGFFVGQGEAGLPAQPAFPTVAKPC